MTRLIYINLLIWTGCPPTESILNSVSIAHIMAFKYRHRHKHTFEYQSVSLSLISYTAQHVVHSTVLYI